jgi:hypothetical protein
MGKQALIHTRKMVQQTKYMLSTNLNEFETIEEEATHCMSEISERSYQLIQDILLLYDQQMKSASTQRDDLILRVMTESDVLDIVTSIGACRSTQLDCGTVMTYLREKLGTSMVLKNYSAPDSFSMGQLYQDSDMVGGLC